jgi:hypothetical protein
MLPLLPQNATLAGGVAMGSSAALRLSPGGAVAVGLFAGTLSTFGFGWLAGVLEQKLNLGDTCGVHVSSVWVFVFGEGVGRVSYGWEVAVSLFSRSFVVLCIWVDACCAGGQMAGCAVSRCPAIITPV